ncbi:NirD/YgiW/YdeI family stress tolerance protein [Chitinophaga solisilvae]|uniref:NirD/YgiW/YdeI family stress tolerance protein n=1 Tax=Chitinophaga solisilvae TaxID=1233460 RepID=A0A3S1DQW7_9BACT|nr:NirD/YgiW/YdeI family stress tolerance protein [Chitinophaga solisilvae]NSL87078.1 NirD/YgiW/YdeI family stress tolerance protein [Chitinophaga solisilvae]
MKYLLLCLLLSGLVFQIREYTIGEVLKNARRLTNDSVTVKITGYITKKVGKSIYLFEDRTAEIKVEIENKFLPARPFDERIPVIIHAMVDYEINKPVTLTANRPVVFD